jgi:hypothetical protein
MKDGLFQRTDMDRIGHVYRVPWYTWVELDIRWGFGMLQPEGMSKTLESRAP